MASNINRLRDKVLNSSLLASGGELTQKFVHRTLPTLEAGDTRFVPPVWKVNPNDIESTIGWGFKDSEFLINEKGNVTLTGNRYNISGIEMPYLLPWMCDTMAIELDPNDIHEMQYPPDIPKPRAAKRFLTAAAKFLNDEQISNDDLVRLRHGHGHTQEEIYAIRYGKLPRVPDYVVFPESEEQVIALVDAATTHNICLIPYGGGTNVTDALRCPADEKRVIVSVDMKRMSRILWIDPVNRMACIEAGAQGRNILDQLKEYGFTIGHEPDSVEFSTIGGWIATNASGMKKNRYGNIEDIVLDMTVVTPAGVVQHNTPSPRESTGIDPRKWMFGSEGNFGIVTSAIVKLFDLPEVVEYGSVIFPTFEDGFNFLFELSRTGQKPASIRLVDNVQFQFGQALKPEKKGFAVHKSKLEALLVTKIKGFDPQKLVAATIVFEGRQDEVKLQQDTVYRLATKYKGMKAGAENGKRGYELTYGIAYIRDLVFRHYMLAESFETSVAWSDALELCERVKQRCFDKHAEMGLPGKPFVTCRVTQLYDTGVCIYFYLGFYHKGIEHPSEAYLEVERAAREEILACGGSLSHHHGIGKIRTKFLDTIQSPGSLEAIRRGKEALDPGNVFGVGNQGLGSQE